MELTCCVSKGNIKLDQTRNLSLPPTFTCSDLPCYRQGCYALKAYRRYPSVREGWWKNLTHYVNNPDGFFKMVTEKLQRAKKNTNFFRWHTGGEITDQKYLNGMFEVARNIPKTHFLVFTKKYFLDFSQCPENLEIIPSSWPGVKIPHKKLRDQGLSIAWMQDGKDNRRIRENKRNSFECPGDCSRCRVCWFASRNGRDIIFKKH